jgi:hypothetical protein
LPRGIQVKQFDADETKVGFFGVGFYSLFSICEEPFITSGEHTMGFFWRKDMLYTKRGILPENARSEWTTFYLTCREPIELPAVDEFSRFLASCLAFTTKLQRVEVFFDNERVIQFHRRGQVPRPLEIVKGAYHVYSPHKIFKLESISISQIQLDVEIGGKFDIRVTLFMKIATGTARVSLPSRMIDEMQRTTKKSPPKAVSLMLMLSNFEEHDSTLQTIRGSESIFEQLIPHPERQGHVFIGFPTHQTTGCPIQIAGHFIPTVERESIDFVDKTLQVWNVEYLSVFGILARICFDNEAGKIKELLANMNLDKQSAPWVYNKVGHNLQMFHFQVSTPSSIVGRIVSEHFYKSNAQTLEMISKQGTMMPIVRLRLPPSNELAQFIKTIPVLPEEFLSTCPAVIEDYKKRKILIEITIADVLGEISSRALPLEDLLSFFRWWIRSVYDKKVTRADLEALQKNLLYLRDESPFPMNGITHFSTHKLVPPELPLPPYCLWSEISKNFDSADLRGCFWNWKELTLIEWVRFIADTPSFGKDIKYTNRVMQTISRHFPNSPQAERAVIVGIMTRKSCVETQLGLKVPSDSYFPSVSLFEDLPRLSPECCKGMAETYLKAIGVREHVELQLIFDRLGDLSWDQTQLIKYLSSIQDKLSDREWRLLSNSPIFMMEGKAGSDRRYLAKQLYAPLEKLRKLEVPMISWPGKWKFTSSEGIVK